MIAICTSTIFHFETNYQTNRWGFFLSHCLYKRNCPDKLNTISRFFGLIRMQSWQLFQDWEPDKSCQLRGKLYSVTSVRYRLINHYTFCHSNLGYSGHQRPELLTNSGLLGRQSPNAIDKFCLFWEGIIASPTSDKLRYKNFQVRSW